ncbi:hypothetical protein HNQ91_000109 [Filimonas zeae]|uniref:Ferritin-like domain-containing protein n=1 Tax=Filimonas zeae TaxID=1737353 RepID=A0A917IL51_9BACT|nr:ferritin-like domain-containing protein [Filimonas zeae]MDR6337087.1 hypothetical protein [Filimonas zeae]GGH56934.1 hypothetical protein GCM10011379_01070 [Filimonas zeae]
MRTSKQWIEHFTQNAKQHRVNWNLRPQLTPGEADAVVASLQAWQLGETSDGRHLLRAADRYAKRINDPLYTEAVSLFIKEEQKHGGNLGKYLDSIGKPRIKADWGDTLFRKIRYFNTSMELWTLAVIVVESTAQVFYQSLKDATGCTLLKQICTDILIDEAWHIDFQVERLSVIFRGKTRFMQRLCNVAYRLFFFATVVTVWMAHRKLFRAGGNSYEKYMHKMSFKCNRIMDRVQAVPQRQRVVKHSPVLKIV